MPLAGCINDGYTKIYQCGSFFMKTPVVKKIHCYITLKKIRHIHTISANFVFQCFCQCLLKKTLIKVKKQGCIATARSRPEKYLCSKGQSNEPLMEKGTYSIFGLPLIQHPIFKWGFPKWGLQRRLGSKSLDKVLLLISS